MPEILCLLLHGALVKHLGNSASQLLLQEAPSTGLLSVQCLGVCQAAAHHSSGGTADSGLSTWHVQPHNAKTDRAARRGALASAGQGSRAHP